MAVTCHVIHHLIVDRNQHTTETIRLVHYGVDNHRTGDEIRYAVEQPRHANGKTVYRIRSSRSGIVREVVAPRALNYALLTVELRKLIAEMEANGWHLVETHTQPQSGVVRHRHESFIFRRSR